MLAISIIIIGPDEVSILAALFRAIAHEAAPDDPHAPTQAEAGIRHARRGYDFLHSDAFWMVVATVGGQPVGSAAVCRMPKADARVGFLYVDERYVLQASRRQGVGRVLFEPLSRFASEQGVAGMRWLVRPENEGARRFYQSLGFGERGTILCEQRTPSESAKEYA